MEKIRLYNLHP